MLASGESIATADLGSVPPWATVAISDTWQLMPLAAACFAADWEWWEVHGARVRREFRGHCYSTSRKHLPDWVHAVRSADGAGLSPDPDVIHCGVSPGKTSTTQAIALAYRWGARRIVLLGVDLGGAHFFGDHPPALSRKKSDYPAFKRQIELLVADLLKAGVEVINCSPLSRIDGCHHLPLAEVPAC